MNRNNVNNPAALKTFQFVDISPEVYLLEVKEALRWQKEVGEDQQSTLHLWDERSECSL